jgi:hypothetical protein
MANRNQGSSCKNNVSPGYRSGPGARGVNVGRVGQLGEKVGSHVTGGGGRETPYRGEGKLHAGPSFNPVPQGNAVAVSTKCGPGGSRTLYGQSGTDQTYGSPAPGNPPERGELFPGWPVKSRP